MPTHLETAKGAFLALPIWAQWIIIALVKSVIASTLMSFLAIYATAVFAMRHGFRVPVEGVPFLHFAIGLATFMTFSATIVLFSIMMVLFSYIKVQIDKYLDYLTLAANLIPWSRRAALTESTRSIVRSFLASKAILVASAACLAFSISILLDARVATELLRQLQALLPTSAHQTTQPGEVALGFAVWSVILVTIWCVENNLSWIAAQIIASIVIFTTMAFGLFANDVYGSFLRIVRYGGGISCIVRYVEGDSKTMTIAKGNLLILTTTQAVIVSSETQGVMEISLKNVATIAYDVHPSWQLPDYELRRQRDFLDLDVSKQRAE